VRAAGILLAGAGLAAPAWGQDLAPHLLTLSAVASVLALLLAVCVLGWALRSWKHQRRMASELQRSRAEAQGLGQLLDVWQWRTDAQHRLTGLKPPQGSTAPLQDIPPGSPPVWAHFSTDDDTRQRLQQLVTQQVPLAGLRVRQATGENAHWVLNGAPMLDHTGCFDGYLGTARDLPDTNAALMNELLNALPMPVLRVNIGATGQMPVLSGSNTAAALWLGDVPPGRLPLLELLHRLPATLRAAVEQAVLQPTAPLPDAIDGWSLRSQRLGHAQPATGTELLLMFHRVALTETGEAAQDDQASFSYTVSHDLRAPIRVVEGFTKIVKEDYGRLIDRIGNDHLDRVLAAAARMSSMIDSLLALSQLSSRPLARQPVNLSQLAGYIIDDLRRQSPERQVQVEIEPGLQAYGDATLLRVVLENLLGNAWKYTGKCRVARIWFERSEHEGRPAITVRDNGAGFDMRFADRLFGVFQRLHSPNDFQGTGVGLASVRRIIRRHGGDIWAEGEVDRGARFQFWLGAAK
jgi:signal transduction histidine kinase